MATLRAVTVNNEGNGKDDGHIRKRPQTPTPLGTADKL